MKLLSDILRHERVWVNPLHRIQSALFLMRGHDVGVLPVLDGAHVIGLLSYRSLLGADTERTVESVMETLPLTLLETMPLRDAAEILVRSGKDALPVLDADGRLRGMITSRELLAELRRPTDPLTGLPWPDTMREWAIERLREGREITLIFFDLNDFGIFNKLYGHVVGDMVLQGIATILHTNTSAETDSVCRYGGDEFCLTTLRRAEEAGDLAERIERDVSNQRIPEAEDRPIGMTHGIRGGRRTREREEIHYASTLNNLINLASRDCMQRKAAMSGGSAFHAEASASAEAIVHANLPDEDVRAAQHREAFAFGNVSAVANTLPNSPYSVPMPPEIQTEEYPA